MKNNVLVTPLLYKEGMRLLAGAVSIIASNGDFGKGGITATSVCSITAEPPTLMVSVYRYASFNEIIKKNNSFSVNILKSGMNDVANVFAGVGGVPMNERLNNEDWITENTGSIRHKDSLASFECVISDIVEMSSHSVIFGNVIGVYSCEEIENPLIYFNQSYLNF